MDLEEFKQKMEEKETIWRRLRYAPIRFWNVHCSNWHRKIKWFFQRGHRGWADCDCWSLDWYLADWLPKALRQLRKTQHGCSAEMFDKEYKKKGKTNECWKWDEILGEMAQGFDEIRKVMNNDHWDGISKKSWTDKDAENARKKDKESTEKFKRSMNLMKRFFLSLWD